MKIALVSSVGGHLTELLELTSGLAQRGHEFIYVLNDESPVLPAGAWAYRITHGERDLGVVKNVFETLAVLQETRPDVVLSAGASPAVSAALACKLMGIPVVYVEPSSAVTQLTLTGRFMRGLADRFFVQWPALTKLAPEAIYKGGLL